MHKLMILIYPSAAWEAQEQHWPEFLRLAESMPNLRREAISRVEQHLFGDQAIVQVHELFFDTLVDAQQAMSSPQGRQAGQLLQQMTGGRMALFFAEHKEDEIANILKYRQQDEAAN
ncbi:MAG: hypothetical protein AB1894_02280 [Chloroflexota bacterium]